MKNLYRRNANFSVVPPNGTRVLVVVTVVFVILGVADWFLSGTLRSIARSALTPVVIVGQNIGNAFFNSAFWKSRSALQQEVSRLQAELARHESDDASLRALQEENELLRALVHLAETEAGASVPLLSSLSSSPYGTFMIGRGSATGVVVGDLVLSPNAFVLGKVVDVTAGSATVQAIFAPSTDLEVSAKTVAFSLTGRGGGNARAQVPREAELHPGDVVHAPSFGGRPVGIVGKVVSTPSSAYSDVFVVFPMNVHAIRFVYVISEL